MRPHPVLHSGAEDPNFLEDLRNMESDNVAEMVESHMQVLHTMEQMRADDKPWTKEQADGHLCFAWTHEKCFWIDLRTREAIDPYEVYVGVTSTYDITEDDFHNFPELIEAADRKEMEAFAQHEVFETCWASNVTSNIVDGTWVRRWKMVLGEWIVKPYVWTRLPRSTEVRRHEAQFHSEPHFSEVDSIIGADLRFRDGDLGHRQCVS